MADSHSFDIVSEVDFQEIDNAVNQAVKEMKNRFDFKGSKSEILFNKTEKKVSIVADDDLKLRNIQDILKTRMSARRISVKSLHFKESVPSFEGTLSQDVGIVSGIEQDKAKEIVKLIKESKHKVQASIQGEQVRVSSKSKDDLQAVMAILRSAQLTIPIQFTNFR